MSIYISFCHGTCMIGLQNVFPPVSSIVSLMYAGNPAVSDSETEIMWMHIVLDI